MSDKDQSTVSKEKENNSKKNKITNKWKEKKRIRIEKESILITFFVTLFLIDLIFMILVDFSMIDLVIDNDLCFSKNFSRSSLGIFTKIFLLGGIIGLLLILFKNVLEFFSKK